MTTSELKALEKIARAEARKGLTRSGGHEVDDVVQSSILQYLDRITKTEVKNSGGMIRMIARRCVWKYRDKWEKKRDTHVLHQLGEADEAARADSGETGAVATAPEDALIVRMDSELVEYAVDQLDPEDREIARLTYLHEPQLKAPEVAERLNLAAGTVRNRLVRIRRLLADLLAE